MRLWLLWLGGFVCGSKVIFKNHLGPFGCEPHVTHVGGAGVLPPPLILATLVPKHPFVNFLRTGRHRHDQYQADNSFLRNFMGDKYHTFTGFFPSHTASGKSWELDSTGL